MSCILTFARTVINFLFNIFKAYCEDQLQVRMRLGMGPPQNTANLQLGATAGSINSGPALSVTDVKAAAQVTTTTSIPVRPSNISSYGPPPSAPPAFTPYGPPATNRQAIAPPVALKPTPPVMPTIPPPPPTPSINSQPPPPAPSPIPPPPSQPYFHGAPPAHGFPTHHAPPSAGFAGPPSFPQPMMHESRMETFDQQVRHGIPPSSGGLRPQHDHRGGGYSGEVDFGRDMSSSYAPHRSDDRRMPPDRPPIKEEVRPIKRSRDRGEPDRRRASRDRGDKIRPQEPPKRDRERGASREKGRDRSNERKPREPDREGDRVRDRDRDRDRPASKRTRDDEGDRSSKRTR